MPSGRVMVRPFHTGPITPRRRLLGPILDVLKRNTSRYDQYVKDGFAPSS